MLKTNSWAHSLDLRGNEMTGEAIYHLIELLRVNHNIIALNLSSNSLDPQSLELLFEFVGVIYLI